MLQSAMTLEYFIAERYRFKIGSFISGGKFTEGTIPDDAKTFLTFAGISIEASGNGRVTFTGTDIYDVVTSDPLDNTTNDSVTHDLSTNPKLNGLELIQGKNYLSFHYLPRVSS